jgi:Protein of unknown function (DUF2975)
MNAWMLSLLKVLIVILFAGGALVAVTFIPFAALSDAQAYPELSYLAIPYAVLAIGTVACAEVILVATWKLAGMVQRGRIFDASALRWVTLMVRSAVLATALVGVVAIHGTFFVPPNPGSITLLGATVGVGAVALILMVMRDMLTTAVQHKAELDEVV